MPEEAIAELLAKQELTEALYRYCRSMDRMDNALGFTVFHEDAEVDYGTMFQGTGHGFVENVYHQHAAMLCHQHQLGNVLIEVDGDRAASESYVSVTFRLNGPDGSLLGMYAHGRYLDRWEKRNGRWAISQRRYVHLLDETRPVPPSQHEGDGRRDLDDPSYVAFALS